MSAASISAISTSLFRCLQAEYWKRPHFETFKKHVENLASYLIQYGDYLISKNKQMKEVHNSDVPIYQLSESLSVEVVKNSLNDTQPYQEIFLTNHCPEAPQQRYQYMHKIQHGLDILVVIMTYSPGNNRGNFHFV